MRLGLLSIVFFFFCQTILAQVFFVENKGQWADEVNYKADIPGGAVFVEDQALTYHFSNQGALAHAHDAQQALDSLEGHAFQWRFFQAKKPRIKRFDPLSGTVNYFRKGVSASALKRYQELLFEEVYPSIDYRLYAYGDGLKYDWLVRPGAKTDDIKLALEGVKEVQVIDGRLHVRTSVNEIIEERPYAYQEINGERLEVPCVFVWKKGKLSFELPAGYDKNYTLVIDPIMVFSSYSGSTANNFGYTATFDDYGFLYAGGTAFSLGYPTTLGAYQTTYNGGVGGTDIVLSKYDTTGTFLVYSTYLGGAADEVPHSLIVHDNELYMMGTTASNDYPVTSGCFDNSFGGGLPIVVNGVGINYTTGCDIVVSRLNAMGTQLLSSTYIGGSGNDGFNTINQLRYNYADEMRGEIDFDSQGNCYIVSSTQSTDFPVVSSLVQPTQNGMQDGVVVKMTDDLSTVLWSTYWGGTSGDAIYSLAFNDNDEVYVCGGTRSSNFQTTTNAYQTAYIGGSVDAFITHFAEDGSAVLNSTFFGSSVYDQAYFIEMDKQDSVYIYGQTRAPDSTLIFNAAFSEANSGQFVAKFHPDLSNIEFSTVFGSGSGGIDISPTAFLVDACNRIYCSGWGGATNTTLNGGPGGHTYDLITTTGAFQTTTDSSDFYLLIMEDNANTLSYASFFGGAQATEHVDGGTSRFDPKGVVYQSVCAGCGGFSDFPTTTGAVSSTNNSSCNNAVFKFDPEFPLTIARFNAPDLSCDYNIQFNNMSYGDNNSYQWFFGDGQTSTLEHPTHSYGGPGSYEVLLISTDPTSCNLLDSVSKTIVIREEQYAALDSIAICLGDSIQLDANTEAGLTYQWSPDSYLNNPYTVNAVAKPEEDITYYLVGSIANCLDTILQHVSVKKVALAYEAEREICGTAILLNAETDSTAQVHWSTNPQFQPYESDSIWAEQPGTYYVKSTFDGCEATATVEVKLSKDCCSEDKIRVPNAFSPNGDNINDDYRVVDDKQIIATFDLNIFNRWGEQVFMSDDANKGWDGSYKGKPLPSAVFDYYLNIGCIGGEQEFFKKGDITLIR
jgi:gliding motility-associated-like protein